MRLDELIRARLAELEQTPTDLQRELAAVGVEVTRQSVHQWLSGGRVSAKNFPALLQVLAIPAAERAAWFAAAGFGQLAAAAVGQGEAGGDSTGAAS